MRGRPVQPLKRRYSRKQQPERNGQFSLNEKLESKRTKVVVGGITTWVRARMPSPSNSQANSPTLPEEGDGKRRGRALNRRVEFKILKQDASKGFKRVKADPDFLQSILRNFLSNARRYTQEGGILLACHFSPAALRHGGGRHLPVVRL